MPKRNRVFDAKYFVKTLNKGKKNGFFGAAPKSCFCAIGDGRGDAIVPKRNPVFDAKYFVKTLNKGKKTGFFGAVPKS